MAFRQSNAAPRTTLCRALISGLLPIWPGAHACGDNLTAGRGVLLQLATESPDPNLGHWSLEALKANKVIFES